MSNIKVSIIIPIYNAEKYIENCLESIINQSLREIEIIIINDGSTDKSKSIVEEYLEKDSRIKLINQKNLGASAARNIGIKESIGEYIGFVDIDDYIETDMYYKMYKTAISAKCDIVICGFVEERKENNTNYNNGLFNNQYLENDNIKKEYLNNIVNDKALGYLPIWNKIFKRELIIKNNIKIKEDLVFGEDRVFCRESILLSNKIGSVNEILYHYRKINCNGVTLGFSKEKIDYYLEDRNEMLEFIKKNIKDISKINSYLCIHYQKIFYKLIDFCLIIVKLKLPIKEKYYLVKNIINKKEMVQVIEMNIYISKLSKVLLYFINKKNYRMVYLLIKIRSIF